MLVTLTEMASGKYSVLFQAHNRRRRYKLLTLGMRDALKARGRIVWSTGGFGKGETGQQRQYEVGSKGGS